MSISPAETYTIACFNCHASFDALSAKWCSCLVTERTIECPHCQRCFCKSTPAYKSRFWSGAPKSLWDTKFSEHRAPMPIRSNPDPSSVTRPLVLLVDDEPDIQRIATRVIESLGYGLVLGKNGKEGLELAQRYKPELVLSDALMPKLDGREMCRRLKEAPETAGIKVVVMTSLYTSVKYHTEGLRSYRADDYLNKPLDFAQLRDLLKKHLG